MVPLACITWFCDRIAGRSGQLYSISSQRRWSRQAPSTGTGRRRQQTQADGDPTPQARFNAVLIGQSDLVFDRNWSSLIAVRGHFSYTGLGPPGSSATIHGTVTTLIVDAATDQVTDSGISNRYPPLARLGRVTTDLRR